MTKKTIIVIASTVLTLLFLSLLGYYFIISNNDSTNNNTIVSGIKNFLPFGGSDYNPEPTPTNTNEGNTEQNNGNTPVVEFTKKLRKISTEAVSGAGIEDSKAGTVLRYIEKATGHVYEVELFSPKIVRLSNTTIPLSYVTIWGNNNSSFVAQYLEEDDNTVDTFTFTLNPNQTTSTTSTSKLAGVSMPNNITDVSVYGSSIFYLQNEGEKSVGIVSSFDNGKKKEIWNSTLSEFNSQYVNETTVLINTRPYEKVSGYLYALNTKTGTAKKILSGIPGLTSLSNLDLTKIAYSLISDELTFFILDTKSGSAIETYPKTFPEKCVWSKKNKAILYCAVPKENLAEDSLTSWYRGIVSLTDDIWVYDTTANTSKILVELEKESGESIDLIRPILSSGEQYLIFINKKDNSLWSLDLTK